MNTGRSISRFIRSSPYCSLYASSKPIPLWRFYSDHRTCAIRLNSLNKSSRGSPIRSILPSSLSSAKSAFSSTSGNNAKYPWKRFKRGGVGRLFVDKNDWKLDPDATVYLKELLETKEVVVPLNEEDVETSEKRGPLHVFKLTKALMKQDRRYPTLVVREDTRKLHEELVTALRMPPSWSPGLSGALVIGTPGIGKSYTIPYLVRVLIRAYRAEQKKPPVIVVHRRREALVFIFVPQKPDDPISPYEAFSTSEEYFRPTGCAALMNSENYYIVDAGDFEGGQSPKGLNATIIYLSSPDRKHYSEFKKDRPITFYMPMPTAAEVLASRPYMAPEIPEETVMSRMEVVGTIPRRVFADSEDYLVFINSLSEAVRGFAPETVGLILQSSNQIIEHLGKVASYVFNFDVVRDGRYRRPIMQLCSPYATHLLLRCHWNSVLMTVASADEMNAGYMGNIFEALILRRLQSGWKVEAESPDNQKLRIETEAPVGEKLYFEWVPKKKTSHAEIWELIKKYHAAQRIKPGSSVAKSPAEKKVTFFPIGRKFPLLDGIDSAGVGYQVTISVVKTLEVDILEKAQKILNLSKENPLKLIYFVPAKVFTAFQVKFEGKVSQELRSCFVWYKVSVKLDQKDWSEDVKNRMFPEGEAQVVPKQVPKTD